MIGTNLDEMGKAKRWIHFSNSNKIIIKSVISILNNLKISHKIRKRVHSGFGSHKIQYEVLIYGKENIEKFYKEVGFSIKRKRRKLSEVINSYGRKQTKSTRL